MRHPDHGGGGGLRVLVLGAGGRLGTILRGLWHPEAGLAAPEATGTGAVAPDPVWQSRRPSSPVRGAGRIGSQVVFDPLVDAEALARCIAGADAVLNLAGPARPGADHAAHADLARAVLRARDRAAGTPARSRVPVLLISSAAVYGRRGGPLREDASCAPESDYGRGKLAMERVAAAAGGAVHVLRLGNVAGADAVLGGAVPGRTVRLDRFADGATPSRAYIGPIGLARVLEGLLRRAVAGAGMPALLNVAAAQVEMAALLDAAGLAWTPRPAPAGAIREVRLDTGRLDALVPLPPPARTARGMVAEWRRLAPTAPRVGGTPG